MDCSLGILRNSVTMLSILPCAFHSVKLPTFLPLFFRMLLKELVCTNWQPKLMSMHEVWWVH